MQTFQLPVHHAQMVPFTSKSASVINLGQNTIETHRILKEHMEELYQNYVYKHDYFIDRESIFKAHVAWLSMGSWDLKSKSEISLGELFGIFMSLYNFWVRPDNVMNDEALNDYIGELFFSARELLKTGPDEKIVQLTGELVCGQDESILKIFYWGSWILETCALNRFSCSLKERGVKVKFSCPSCGHEYKRDTSEIGQKISCIECEKKINVPAMSQRFNTPLTARETIVPCRHCGQKMEKIIIKKRKRLMISGLFTFLTGLTSIFAFMPVIIPGIFLILAGISLSGIAVKLWHCPNCGYFVKW